MAGMETWNTHEATGFGLVAGGFRLKNENAQETGESAIVNPFNMAGGRKRAARDNVSARTVSLFYSVGEDPDTTGNMRITAMGVRPEMGANYWNGSSESYNVLVRENRIKFFNTDGDTASPSEFREVTEQIKMTTVKQGAGKKEKLGKITPMVEGMPEGIEDQEEDFESASNIGVEDFEEPASPAPSDASTIKSGASASTSEIGKRKKTIDRTDRGPYTKPTEPLGATARPALREPGGIITVRDMRMVIGDNDAFRELPKDTPVTDGEIYSELKRYAMAPKDARQNIAAVKKWSIEKMMTRK